MTSPKKASISILVNSKGQILLQLRDNKPQIPSPNQWGFIGGGIEEGENELEAIKRETKEEIGLSPDNFKYLDKFYIKQHNTILFLFIAGLDVPAEDIKLTEGQAVRFFYPSEIKDINMIKILQKMVSKYSENISSLARTLNASQ